MSRRYNELRVLGWHARYYAERQDGLRGGRTLIDIVEVQLLHLKALHAVKSDVHLIYNSIRVLGAMEDAVISHTGASLPPHRVAYLARHVTTSHLAPHTSAALHLAFPL
eukprot:3852082-Prymnesium_polylepis.1